MSYPIRIDMKDLPKPVEIVDGTGKKKEYVLAPSGKLGACLNKAPRPAESKAAVR